MARLGLSTCHVTTLEKYYEVAQLCTDFYLRLFYGMMRCKNEEIKENVTIGYTRVSDMDKQKINSFVYDHSKFVLHSSRAFSWSFAAANAR